MFIFNALISALLAGAPAADAPYGLVAREDSLRAQVAEPVFAFVFRLVEADSLGTWTRSDLEDFVAGWERPSDFPVAHLVTLERSPLPEGATIRRRGQVCDRRIVITIDTDRLDMPMPYSILGYHPGTLSFGGPLVIREWRLGDRKVRVRTGGASRQEAVRGLTIFQLTAGWAVLDADAWLDRLLGARLDDAAILGFVAARVRERLVGVGVSAGRDGRFIYGELDFRRGTVAAHGRPLARGLAGHTRTWTTPDGGDRRAAWRGYD